MSSLFHTTKAGIFASVAAAGLCCACVLSGCGQVNVSGVAVDPTHPAVPLQLTEQSAPVVKPDVVVDDVIAGPEEPKFDDSKRLASDKLSILGLTDEQIQGILHKLDEDVANKKTYHFGKLHTDEERMVYAAIYAAVAEMNPRVTVVGDDLEDVLDIDDALLFVTMDYPEFFWYDFKTAVLQSEYQIIRNGSQTFIECSIDYGDWTPEKARELVKPLRQAAYKDLSHVSIRENRINKALTIFGVVAERIHYSGSVTDQSFVSAALDDKAICSGYALWYQTLCKMCGIPAYYNPCVMKGAPEDESHVTVMLEYEPGKFTMTDPTWGHVGARVTSYKKVDYTYFGFGDKFYHERYEEGIPFVFGTYHYVTPHLDAINQLKHKE